MSAKCLEEKKTKPPVQRIPASYKQPLKLCRADSTQWASAGAHSGCALSFWLKRSPFLGAGEASHQPIQGALKVLCQGWSIKVDELNTTDAPREFTAQLSALSKE